MPARFLFFAQISKTHTRAELPQDGAELHPDRADLHHDRADLRNFTEREDPFFLQSHEVLWFSGSEL